MDAWRRRFVRRLLLAALGFQLPFALLLERIIPLRASLAVPASVLALVLVNVPLLYRVLVRWTDEPRTHWARTWLFDTPYYIHFCALIAYGPLSWLALLSLSVARITGYSHASVASVLGPLYLACFALGAYAVLVRRFWTVVRTVRVPVKGLPEHLQGYRIVQLSDVHCGPNMPRWYYRHLARRANGVGANAIVVTGDIVSEGTGYFPDVTEFFGLLRARDGVFAGLGNHDYYGTLEGIPGAVTAGGARVLRNEGVVLAGEKAGGVYLAAVDDNWSRRDDLERALAGKPAGAPCVVLAHDPAMFPGIAKRGGVDLVLSGHTHGGQFAVPFASRRWNLYRVRHRLSAGVYREGDAMLYVHCGNGTSGPPGRFGAAPEIAVMELVAG